MTKENKVISLGLAQKISEVAKAKHLELAESEYVWIKVYRLKGEFVLRVKDHEWNYYKEFPAFDCSKLGEMLPRMISSFRKDSNDWISVDIFEAICLPTTEKYKRKLKNTIAKNEAECRGKMYYYLMENDLLK